MSRIDYKIITDSPFFRIMQVLFKLARFFRTRKKNMNVYSPNKLLTEIDTSASTIRRDENHHFRRQHSYVSSSIKSFFGNRHISYFYWKHQYVKRLVHVQFYLALPVKNDK